MPRSLPDPECLALVFCNEVIEDKRTNKKSLIGIFNRVSCSKFPTKQAMFLFVSLTSLHASQPIKLVIVADTENGEQEILKIEGEVGAARPTDVLDLIFEIDALPITAPTTHVAKIVAGSGTVLMQRRFLAVANEWSTPA